MSLCFFHNPCLGAKLDRSSFWNMQSFQVAGINLELIPSGEEDPKSGKTPLFPPVFPSAGSVMEIRKVCV